MPRNSSADKLLKVVLVLTQTAQGLIEDNVRSIFHARVPDSCREQFHDGIVSSLAAIEKLRNIAKYGRMVNDEGWTPTQEFAYGVNDIDLKGEDLKRWNQIIKKRNANLSETSQQYHGNQGQKRSRDQQWKESKFPKKKTDAVIKCFACKGDGHYARDCKDQRFQPKK